MVALPIDAEADRQRELARIRANLARWPKLTDKEILQYAAKAAEAREKYELNFANPPPTPIPRYWLAGKAICTPGNLTNLIAQPKAGKSAFLAAMISARSAAQTGNECDLLGLKANGIPGALIHLDTEQSKADHYGLIKRSLDRAQVSSLPDWLSSYSFAGVKAKEIRELLRVLIWERAPDGIFAVLIDGTADLVNDVNDAEECNEFVAELHSLAIQYDCPIVSVVHENPAGTTGKMRGHLGSQLERKAESNLRLNKTDDTTVVFSEKQRGAPIFEKDGPRFKWSDAASMHVSVGTTRRDDANAVEREHLQDIADDLFAETKTMRHSDLIATLESRFKKSESWAKRKFVDLRNHKVIQWFPPNLYAKAI